MPFRHSEEFKNNLAYNSVREYDGEGTNIVEQSANVLARKEEANVVSVKIIRF